MPPAPWMTVATSPAPTTSMASTIAAPSSGSRSVSSFPASPRASTSTASAASGALAEGMNWAAPKWPSSSPAAARREIAPPSAASTARSAPLGGRPLTCPTAISDARALAMSPAARRTTSGGGGMAARLAHRDELRTGVGEAGEDGGKRLRRRPGPAVQEHHGAVARAVEHGALDGAGGGVLVPVPGIDVPAHVAVPELAEEAQDARVLHAGAERAAEPRPWVDPGDAVDRLLRPAHVVAQRVVAQRVHRRVVVRVIADRVARARDPARALGMRADPAALEEERGARAGVRERREDPLLDAVGRRAAGELGVEGEGDAHLQRGGHLRQALRAVGVEPLGARERAV